MPKSVAQSHPARPPLCASAPVLWSLFPLILGIISVASDGLSLMLSLLLLVFAVSFYVSMSRRIIMVTSFVLGGVLQWTSSEQPHPDWEMLPKREATLLLEIDELFNARDPEKISGIGKILQTDIPHDTITGTQASFYLKSEVPQLNPCSTGQQILCQGVLTYLPFLKTHDGFQDYLIGRDIFTTYNQGFVLKTTAAAPLTERLRNDQFHFFQNALCSGIEHPESPGNVLGSMLLGDRSLLRDEQIELYRQSGTYHLFAVSGLHVGCVALFIGSLFRFGRLPSCLIPLPVLLATWYYVWLTGSSPSASRAGIMISCLVGSRLLLRQPHLFPALAFSAWLVLLLFPEQLFDLGFQLSYSVVASITLVGLPASSAICNRIRSGMSENIPIGTWWRYLLRLITASVDIGCISLSAGIVSMPLIMEHFQLFTPGGVIIGIVLNPLSTIVIMLGCLTMCTAPVYLVLAEWIARITWPLVELIEWILRTCIQVPGAYSTRVWIVPHFGTILIIVALIVAWILQYLRQHFEKIPNVTLLLPFMLVFTGLLFGSLDA